MNPNKPLEEAAKELNPYSAPEFTTVWNQGFYAGASTPGMRWVKASEHPKSNGEYYCKYCHPFSTDIKAAEMLEFNDGEWYSEHPDIANLYWLDESASLENFVSKEHYDELKLNYDIWVEENKRLNKRERELGEALEDLMEAVPRQTDDADWWEDNLTEAMSKAKAALSNHKP